MALATLKRLRYPGMLPVAALMIVLFIALDLMSGAVQNSEALSRTFVPCLLYTSPSPRDGLLSRMPSSA